VKQSDVVEWLTEQRDETRRRLESAGGRSVELAEKVDRYQAAIDALLGILICGDCGRQLTGF
jgi:hypothetical protein